MHCRRMKVLAIISPQKTKSGFAQLRRLFEHSIEHWREVAGRGIDDLQYLGCGGLPLQCPAEIAVARLDLVEQTRVLEGDDGLVGEGLKERDLDRGERPDCARPATDDADRLALTEDR